ncbi:MAG: hypothetical protein H3C43_11395 [Leptonema sp. (in: Bacteria)]|nr:hypothetical protein [Leptonema sp. (in: bacteria)]
MKRIFKQTLGIGAVSLFAVALIAKPKIIDRENEKKEYPDLQTTEGILDQNINAAYKRIALFGPLVPMAKEDRDKYFKERQEPLDFRHSLKNIVYTPRNSYVRYVKEGADFLLVGLGDTAETQAKIAEKIAEAKAAGVNVNDLAFQERDGIELTQFEFIYDDESVVREAVGSRRKSVSLFYTRNSQGDVDTEDDYTLNLVVTRVVHDNFKKGVKDVEVVIDPSPLTENMDDVVVVHRYNQKPSQALVVGTMSNTPNFPQRNTLKQKFYVKLLDDYNTLFRLVDGYAKKDGNAYNDTVLDLLKASTEY